jgi:F-type H+-transporting ATPase subunit epsilon
MRISRFLEQQLLAEEEKLHAMKESLHHMEEEILKRLWRMGRRGEG